MIGLICDLMRPLPQPFISLLLCFSAGARSSSLVGRKACVAATHVAAAVASAAVASAAVASMAAWLGLRSGLELELELGLGLESR